ncbi:MAG: hypothetical protein R2789_08905 [Microthrixaceae bacterium]
MSAPIRVAMTLTQDWHEVPGGTAVAANELAHCELSNDEEWTWSEWSLPELHRRGSSPGTHRRTPPGTPAAVRLLDHRASPSCRRQWRCAGVQIVHSTVPIAVPEQGAGRRRCARPAADHDAGSFTPGGE